MIEALEMLKGPGDAMPRILALKSRLESHIAATGAEEKGEITHLFTPGLYTRTMKVPTGALIISKIHRTEHPFILSEGVMLVVSSDGISSEVRAPYIGVTKPGTCRVGYALQPCTWTTFHPTSKTDLAEIEAEIIEPFPEVQKINETS